MSSKLGLLMRAGSIQRGKRLMRSDKWPRGRAYSLMRVKVTGNNGIKEFKCRWEKVFMKWNIPQPELSVRFILDHVWQKTTGNRAAPLKFSSQQYDLATKLMQLRLKRVPVQYIVGEWEFRNLTLKLRPPVLIPRPETEELVGLVLQHCCPGYSDREVGWSSVRGGATSEEVTFLDVGCGSGAITLSLLEECPQMVGYGVDVSEEAIELTRENAERTGLSKRLTLYHCSIDDLHHHLSPDQNVDVIVSNPPYIRRQDIPTLDPSIVWYEDWRALDGGEDGMEVTAKILEMSARYLKKGGQIWLELGLHQHTAHLLTSHPHWHLTHTSSYKDMTQRLRFHQLRRK